VDSRIAKQEEPPSIARLSETNLRQKRGTNRKKGKKRGGPWKKVDAGHASKE